MTAETIEAMREGDIFRWRYNEPKDEDRSWGSYHCCSGFAVVRNGRLCDTYWSTGNDGRSFGAEDLPKLDLTRLGNFAELNKSRESEADYYDDADIINLNHANSSRGNFYLRRGAQRSVAKMLQAARNKLEDAESDMRIAASRAERLREAIARIEAGDTGSRF
jgi:hypothetical protein